ncbi:MAG: 4-hydroxythreonine-4-phosphate dehydrogenase PdxA [Chloroflexi bacterium]|nr:4-hydroxythreonine-4-phosphate dehydrogenase PdxA [Chloroflexota bacterium]MDA1271136.1 4-hydroxythreonine-4-phosphate dehydrogenase PdxA [Chloroflexota bacterium]PKB58712.1 MAG: 4-hydroxythreonine-4-phosphate dehydrogenase PdxA [SAR202 cluster bacterium Casp-Chloro-G2]
MTTGRKPAIAITMGDPCGIGPEVVVKAMADPKVYATCRPLVVGNVYAMQQAVSLTGVPLKIQEASDPAAAGQDPGVIDVVDIHNLNPEDITVGQINPTCGKAAMEWVTKAGELALAGVVDALATAPLNKEAASLAGYKSIGHMELLQELSKTKTVATMLMAKNLRVVHLSTHRSLRLACDLVKKDRILEYVKLTHESFVKFGFPSPKIGVAALNPHGSDGGLLGDEEAQEIAPAVEAARSQGINAIGPVPADIIFHQAIQDQYDVVVCMYHDQGHIPVKVYGFEESITANLGLPFVRTSVDHGTAFDIAGKGVASHESMEECIRLAVALAQGNGLTHF